MLATKLKIGVGCFVLLILGSLFAYQPLVNVFAGESGGSGQIPLAVPGASEKKDEKKDVASQNKGPIVLRANLKLKYVGNDSEEDFSGIIAPRSRNRQVEKDHHRPEFWPPCVSRRRDSGFRPR